MSIHPSSCACRNNGVKKCCMGWGDWIGCVKRAIRQMGGRQAKPSNQSDGVSSWSECVCVCACVCVRIYLSTAINVWCGRMV